MLAKVSIVVYLIAAILHFTNGQMSFFWLSVVLGIVVAGLSMYMSYIKVSPELKEFRDTVKKIEADGASDDEILAFMDQDTELDESKLQNPPLWMFLFTLFGVVAGFALFVIGVNN